MRKLIIIFSLIVSLFFTTSCNSIFGPEEICWEEKYITVEVAYQRVDDWSECELKSPCHEGPVYLAGFESCGLTRRKREMAQVGCDLFEKIVEEVQVNYPREEYNLPPYKIYVLDNGFCCTPRWCLIRAHRIFLNGKEIKKIHKGSGSYGLEEYILVAFDENGFPHEF